MDIKNLTAEQRAELKAQLVAEDRAEKQKREANIAAYKECVDEFCPMLRGRSKSLIQKRDEALCRRWYYWTEERRLRSDDAVKVLSEQEFFISEQRVLAVIRKYSREHPDGKVKPKPRVKVPRLTATQLTLFTGE